MHWLYLCVMFSGVPVVHLITYPFPSVWHTPYDDLPALDFDRIDNLARILRVFLVDLPLWVMIFFKGPLLVKVWMGLPAVSPKIIVYLGLNLQSYVFANTNSLTGHIVTLWSTFFFRPYHRHIHRERCYALCEVLTWWWKCWTFCSLLVWQVLPHVEGCFYSDRQNLMPGSWCWFERLLHVLSSEILLKI